MRLLQSLRQHLSWRYQDIQISYITLLWTVAVISATYYCVNLKYMGLTSCPICPNIKQNVCTSFPETTDRRSLKLTQVTFTNRQEIFRELVIVTQALQAAQNNQIPFLNNSIRALRRILTQINPEYVHIKVLEENKPLTKTQSVCGETFTNRTHGIPYYENEKGWITVPCTAPPIGEIVSIVLNPLDSENCSQYVDWILKGANKTYPSVIVYIATNPKCDVEFAKNYSKVHLVSVSSSDSSGNVWMKLLAKVTTQYVLVARNLFHFTNFSRLERQISIISNANIIPIAGGATRNITGHWSVGCFQTQMRNYILEYVEGYHVSRNECMFCDYLAGPFIARTDIFDEIPLHSSLPEALLFHNFFLELKKANYLAANCPDAMYFANTQRAAHSNKDSWIPLARQWQLNRILLPNGVKHIITCKESKLSCKRSVSKAYLIPLCCRKKYLRLLKKLTRTGISYEFRDGDVLAAVKMRGSIPWDTDTDLNVKATGKQLWKKAKEELKRIKFKSFQYGNWLSVHVPYTHINIDPIKELSHLVLLPEELKNLPTLVEYDGEWLVGPASPGLYARNAYGVEIFKHVQSYSIYGHSDPYELYTPGTFLPCPDPHHHACLDHFSTDGNIQFMAP